MAERTLTDADIEALVKALQGQHVCRFHVTAEEFEQTWPVMRDLANSVDQAKKISFRILFTGLVLFLLGAIGRGLWVLVTEMHTKLPLPR